jgi:hypothetical protein
MVFLVFLAIIPARTPVVVRPVTDATATVRIVRGEAASRDWNDHNVPHKRQVEVREADGGRTQVRLIEHE